MFAKPFEIRWSCCFRPPSTSHYLAHQTLLDDRCHCALMVRSFVTGKRLLEWETAAEAEAGMGKRTPVEITMGLVPLLCRAADSCCVDSAIGNSVGFANSDSVVACQAHHLWLNRSTQLELKLSDGDTRFLRKIAWRTWLYFAQYAAEGHNGLVPDNVQEEGNREALRISPTNAGMQLNARQAAVILGYLTFPEYAKQTLTNLQTLDGIPKWKGHLLNWYTTTALEPIRPYIASSVDSGNFLASLCSLRMGTLEVLETPMLPALRQGLLDIVMDTKNPSAADTKIKSALRADRKAPTDAWLRALLTLELSSSAEDSGEATTHLQSIRKFVADYLPWLLPKFSELLQSRKCRKSSTRFLHARYFLADLPRDEIGPC